MPPTIVNVTDPEGPTNSTKIIVPGKIVYLSHGIKYYQRRPADENETESVSIYGNSDEEVGIEADRVVLVYGKKRGAPLFSQAQFSVKNVDIDELVARLEELGVPSGPPAAPAVAAVDEAGIGEPDPEHIGAPLPPVAPVAAPPVQLDEEGFEIIPQAPLEDPNAPPRPSSNPAGPPEGGRNRRKTRVRKARRRRTLRKHK